MVIAFKARNEFENRRRKDYNRYKTLTEDQLEQRMLALPVQPPIWYKLTFLQKVCFIIGAETQRFCFFNDTGTGKSLLAIALIRYFRRLGILKHALILVPNLPNKYEWHDELMKHSPNSSFQILEGSSTEKMRAIAEENALFYFETYAGLFRMVCDKEERKKRGTKVKIQKLVPNPKKVQILAKKFGGFICDESVNVGNHTALPFRVCRKLSQTSEVVFTMTGTPFNRDPVLMWAQMYLVDHGFTLGETLGLFRSSFCSEVNNFFSGHKEYKFLKKNQAKLNEFISNASISFPADEGSLPECVPINKMVAMPTDAVAYYERFKEKLIASQGNFNETKSAFIRMRQIASGFVGYDDDEIGAKAKFEFPDNPKLDMLLSLLSVMQPEHKVVVFIDFNYSGEKILAALTRAKIPALLLYGKTQDVQGTKHAFVKDPKKRVLILQNKMAAGLNIQVAKYGIFYEMPVSAIDHKQARRRVERQHSLYKTVFIYYLLMRDTVDEQIQEFHKEGGDLFNGVIRGAKKRNK